MITGVYGHQEAAKSYQDVRILYGLMLDKGRLALVQGQDGWLFLQVTVPEGSGDGDLQAQFYSRWGLTVEIDHKIGQLESYQAGRHLILELYWLQAMDHGKTVKWINFFDIDRYELQPLDRLVWQAIAAQLPWLVIMNFSGIYALEHFYDQLPFLWLDCSQLVGTNGFLDTAAQLKIKQKMLPLSYRGIHYIDNGNHHYMTKLWLEKITTPFCLVVFDHHSDMEKPLFTDILSCGSWIIDSLKDCDQLKRVILVGLSSEQVAAIEPDFLARVICVPDRQMLLEDVFIPSLCLNLPVYLSLDKDVLSVKELQTTWDQGSMTQAELHYFLQLLLSSVKLLGVDICGDCDQDLAFFTNIQKDDQLNRLLLKWLLT